MPDTNKKKSFIIYREHPISLYPMVRMRVSIDEMKLFIDAKLDYGLSAKNAIKSKKVFCNDCIDPSFKKYTP